ncbi:MAG: quinone oxidoreductase [Actinobacteria bacterium]|nr:quinone oxidoreductase [Actinomycetota bacterium]
MQAVRVHQQGGPELLRYESVPDPTPGPGQVVLRLEAIGVNYVDIYQRSGTYQLKTPFTLGVEGAGVIEAVGAEVTGFTVGERAAHASARGAYAERQAVPADQLVKLPAGVDARTAASALLQGMTAHFLAHSTIPLRAGHTVLIHAGAGGVGRLLIQMAKRAGAYVLTTVSSEAKAEVARAAGADEVILYTHTDFAAAVRAATDGKGLDVVYDSVGQATFLRSLECLRPRGLLALFGAASGPVPAFDPQILNQKGSLFLTRPSLGHYTRTREELEWRTGDVFAWITDGSLKLKLHAEYPLAAAADAHRALQSRATTGKLLLTP